MQALELLAAARQLLGTPEGLPAAFEQHWLARLQASAVATLCLLQGRTLTVGALRAAEQACLGGLTGLKLPQLAEQVCCSCVLLLVHKS